MNEFCSLYPYQSVKTVRLRLNLTGEFVVDPRLNVKVLLLIRDPRGTTNSRRGTSWCKNSPDCEDPKILCSDLVDDYRAYVRLKEKYPSNYEVLKYEDLSTDYWNITLKLY